MTHIIGDRAIGEPSQVLVAVIVHHGCFHPEKKDRDGRLDSTG